MGDQATAAWDPGCRSVTASPLFMQAGDFPGFNAIDLAPLIANQVSQHLEQTFQRLKRDWLEERSLVTSLSRTSAMCDSYQRIIGLGPQVIPLILRELTSEAEPDDWFWALAALTWANPVPPGSRGNLREMAKAWLTWGREHGYLNDESLGVGFSRSQTN